MFSCFAHIYSRLQAQTIVTGLVSLFICLYLNITYFGLATAHIIKNDTPEPWTIGFQDGVSPGFSGIVELHDNIFFYLVVIAILVFWMLGSTIYYFNYDRTKISHKYLVHGTLIEIVWTIFPAIVLLAIAIPSFRLLYILDEVTLPTITVKVTGFLTNGPKSYIINKIKNTKGTVNQRNYAAFPLESEAEQWEWVAGCKNYVLLYKILYKVQKFYIYTLVKKIFKIFIFIFPQERSIFHCPAISSEESINLRYNYIIGKLNYRIFPYSKFISSTSARAVLSSLPLPRLRTLTLAVGQGIGIAVKQQSHQRSISIRTFNTRCRAINRIGPHNIDVISVIFGLLLGDGYANNRSGEGVRIAIKQSEIHKEYLFYLYNFFLDRGYCSNLEPRKYTRTIEGINKIYFGYEFNTYTFRSFLWIYNSFYKNGQKIIPLNLEKYMNSISLSIWIMDDGGWTGSGVRISANSFTYEELKILKEILEKKFTLDCTIQKISINKKYSLYIKKNSINKLREITIPYFHKSMFYKLGL
jgi:hypothetical protein